MAEAYQGLPQVNEACDAFITYKSLTIRDNTRVSLEDEDILLNAAPELSPVALSVFDDDSASLLFSSILKVLHNVINFNYLLRLYLESFI